MCSDDACCGDVIAAGRAGAGEAATYIPFPLPTLPHLCSAVFLHLHPPTIIHYHFLPSVLAFAAQVVRHLQFPTHTASSILLWEVYHGT